MLEIEPGLNQVVFAGDSLRLRCRVSGQRSTDRVWWRKGDSHYHNQEDVQEGISVRTTSDGDKVER